MKFNDPSWARFTTMLVWLLIGWPMLIAGASLRIEMLGNVGLAIILVSGIYLLVVVTRVKK